MAMSKSTPKEAIDMVSKALEQLKQSGRLDEIFRSTFNNKLHLE